MSHFAPHFGQSISLEYPGVRVGISYIAEIKHVELAEQFGKFGYPEGVLIAIGITEVVCVVLYLLPQTAVLGAVMLTGYLGGAIATHVRVHDNFISPVIVGVFVWLALYLRDPRVRALLPLRQNPIPN